MTFKQSLRLLMAVVACCFAAAGQADPTFTATLHGAQEVPATGSPATGVGTVILNAAENRGAFSFEPDR